MIKFKQKAMLALLAVGIGFTGSSSASLFDRGGGLIYDSDLNVTWLQDANYAHTSGYAQADSTGKMDWATATAWAANLDYSGYSDWRLASNAPVNGISFQAFYNVTGSTDVGYNITSSLSELAYMYNVNLGLLDWYSPGNEYQPTFGIFRNGVMGGQNNVDPFINVQSYSYWSGSGEPYTINAYGFDMGAGLQNLYQKSGNQIYAWAVRPGDVAAVPLPATIWLFASGLGLLSFTNRTKQKQLT